MGLPTSSSETSDEQKMSPLHLENPGKLTVKDAALIGSGMLCVSCAAMFYRAKRTTPFKIAYFLSWPILGAASLNAIAPDKTKLEQELRNKGFQQQIEENRHVVQLQLDSIRKNTIKHNNNNDSK